MTDDIVTRLREALEVDDSILLTMPRPTVQMMADEIERLRAENDGLRIRIYTLLKKLDGEAVRDE